jgi:hypothetical protein
MPQFDFYSFVSQTFWILLFLGFFYFFILFFYLSKYAEVIKFRKSLKFFYKFNNSLLENRITIYDQYLYSFFLQNSFLKINKNSI